MTVAATEQHHGLALASEQDWWTEKQLAALRQIGVERASNGDLAVFMHVCQRTGLDPFARQIYMIQRDGKQVIQTGIDGMRLVARRAVDRTGEAFGIGAPEWCGPDGQWTDVWLSPQPPAAARVTVTRGDGTFTAIALWHEYVQTKRDGQITRMWATRGAGQLAKCAEALALRKACPQDLSGIYSEDEIAREHRERPQSRLGAVLNQTSGAEEEAPDQATAVEPHANASAPESDPITSAQLQKIGILCGELGLTDAAEARREVGVVIGREIGSRKDLSKAEAHRVIDHFTSLAERPFEPVDAEVVEDGQ